MRRAGILCPLLLTVGVANADAAALREVTRLTALPDSVPCITCLDVRTGATFGMPVTQVSDSGSIATATSLASRLCVGALAAVHSVVEPDGEGGAYVAWVEPAGEHSDLRLQRVGSTGAVAEGWPPGGRVVCDARGSQLQPTMARDGASGLWLAWTDHRGATRSGVRLLRLGPDGAPSNGWPEGGASASPSGAAQAMPRLAAGTDGRMWLLWQEGPAGGRDLRARVFESSGAPAVGWPDTGRVVVGGAADQMRPRLASDAAGGMYVAWSESHAGGASVHLTRLDGSGDAAAGWSSVTFSGASDEARVTSLLADSASVSVAWTSGQEDSVLARVTRRTPSGVVASGWPEAGLVLGVAAGDDPVLRADGSGGVYAAWTRTGAGGDGVVVLVRLTGAGALATGWPAAGLELPDTPGDEHAPRLASVDAGVLVSWSRGQGTPGGTVLRSGATLGETLPELRTRASWPDLVRLEWSLTGEVPYTVAVEKLAAHGEWELMRELSPDEEGHMPLEDHDITAGSRVRYRLRLSTPSLQATMPEVEVTVPLAAPLALHRIQLQGERLQAWFSLPSREEARLEVFDVQGRRVFRQAVRVDHAGESEASWPTPVRLRSGVWFARLTQGRESRGTRVVLTR